MKGGGKFDLPLRGNYDSLILHNDYVFQKCSFSILPMITYDYL